MRMQVAAQPTLAAHVRFRIPHSAFRIPHSAFRPRGLTLIELLVTIVILVTLLAAVLPAVSPNNEARKIREASRQLTSLFAQAQAQAARDGRAVGVGLHATADETTGMALEAYIIAEPPVFTGFSPRVVGRVLRRATASSSLRLTANLPFTLTRRTPTCRRCSNIVFGHGVGGEGVNFDDPSDVDPAANVPRRPYLERDRRRRHRGPTASATSSKSARSCSKSSTTTATTMRRHDDDTDADAGHESSTASTTSSRRRCSPSAGSPGGTADRPRGPARRQGLPHSPPADDRLIAQPHARRGRPVPARRRHRLRPRPRATRSAGHRVLAQRLGRRRSTATAEADETTASPCSSCWAASKTPIRATSRRDPDEYDIDYDRYDFTRRRDRRRARRSAATKSTCSTPTAAGWSITPAGRIVGAENYVFDPRRATHVRRRRSPAHEHRATSAKSARTRSATVAQRITPATSKAKPAADRSDMK